VIDMSVTMNNAACGSPDSSVVMLEKSNEGWLTAVVGETTLKTYTLPGGTLGANDTLRISTTWEAVGTAGARHCIVWFGTFNDELMQINIQGENSLNSIAYLHADNSTSAQFFTHKFGVGGDAGSHGEATASVYTLAFDTTVEQTIGFSVRDLDSPDTVELKAYAIELLKGTV
jgi:hypothetical protein